MNINKEIGTLPADFNYDYVDNEGNEKSENIKLRLKRITFRKTAAIEFRDAMKRIEEEPEVIAGFLTDYIASWTLFLDDEEQEMFPITVDNIAERSPEFVLRLSEAVCNRLFPNFPKAENSQDGSAQTAKSAAQPS